MSFRELLTQLPRLSAPHALVRAAVDLLRGPRPPSIEALARELGCTRQHLTRAFREQVGITPKHFSKIARLQRALVTAQHVPRAATLAVCAGYFDQAHMSRDFRARLGIARARAGLRFHSSYPLAVRRAIT